jgi:hypothetical protein
MIDGICFSFLTIVLKAQGRQAGTVIAAAAMLDSEGLTVSEDFGIQQKRSPTVEGTILQSLTKVRFSTLDIFEQNFISNCARVSVGTSR